MRYGSREWFVATPEKIRAESRRRRFAKVGGLDVLEPATEEEAAVMWAQMRGEEKREALDAGGDESSHRKAVLSAERSFAIYHGDALLAVATVDTLPDGRKFLSMERTAAALERGHRFTWLRAYGPLGLTIGSECPDGIWAVTPTDLPRALDVYRHAGARPTGETVRVGEREYWVLRIGGSEWPRGGRNGKLRH